MSIDINYEIGRLVKYGIDKGILDSEDRTYGINRILEVMKLDDYAESDVKEYSAASIKEILDNLVDWAIENGLIEDTITERDLFDTKLMSCITPPPSVIRGKFWGRYALSPAKATDYYYDFARVTNYIRVDRIEKDLKWRTKTVFGDLDITINLSKPEKDPKDIERARSIKSSSYPACLLCVENEGYAGRINHPGRGNHRLIPIELNNENWYMQYSPYVYYNEHCIVLKETHDPMKLCYETFVRITDFVQKFPHYFIGSNADIPIVGGSILSHDHFQGGRYEFAMERAKIEKTYPMHNMEGVTAGRVKWPMSVIRLESSSKEDIVKAAFTIYEKWKKYSDPDVDIISETDGVPHNTVTPIARMKNGNYQVDLVLRNNRRSNKHPEGIFHPHRELHHIKKENIGLIEVMGLAVLPSRLDKELNTIEKLLIDNTNAELELSKEPLLKHKEWFEEIKRKHPQIEKANVKEILEEEVGLKFMNVLEDAGVFKRDLNGKLAFDKFMSTL